MIAFYVSFFHHIFQAGAFAAWCFLDISGPIKCTICLALSWNVTLWWCCLVASSFAASVVWTLDWDNNSDLSRAVLQHVIVLFEGGAGRLPEWFSRCFAWFVRCV